MAVIELIRARRRENPGSSFPLSDFSHWQSSIMSGSSPVPKGAWLIITAHFDNSTQHLSILPSRPSLGMPTTRDGQRVLDYFVPGSTSAVSARLSRNSRPPNRRPGVHLLATFCCFLTLSKHFHFSLRFADGVGSLPSSSSTPHIPEPGAVVVAVCTPACLVFRSHRHGTRSPSTSPG